MIVVFFLISNVSVDFKGFKNLNNGYRNICY